LADGSRHTIIKHYLTEQQARDTFRRHAERVDVHLFPDARRYVVDYRLPT
jgi:hypothetical protein